jgi:cell fate (sporulation/competence/biofilm development) regulator YlbF (YheA/YmcA/DUF963 family)
MIYMLYICTVSNKQKTNIMTIQDLTQEYNRLQEKKRNVKSFGRKMYYEKLQIKVTAEIRKIQENENI